jgi:hypothetical protein
MATVLRGFSNSDRRVRASRAPTAATPIEWWMLGVMITPRSQGSKPRWAILAPGVFTAGFLVATVALPVLAVLAALAGLTGAAALLTGVVDFRAPIGATAGFATGSGEVGAA